METEKDNIQFNTEGVWQWQSNLDPWSKSEEPQWESYSSKLNLLIEKAYFSQQEEVDIGTHIVSVEHMLQWKKGLKELQRPIRRKHWLEDDDMIYRCERYSITESPKTINHVFGSLKDFLHYFSSRNNEILGFSKLFEKAEKSRNIDDLNKKILPRIFGSLEEESKKIAKMSNLQKRNKDILLELFLKPFQSFKAFYSGILKAYTMSTFLYLNLNRYLRNESWKEIEDLLSYAYCLCKAFFTGQHHDEEKTTASYTAEMTLFRGTVLDKKSLEVYNTNLKTFSWNSVTSTTKNKQIAKKFMNVIKDKEQKFPVMFEIQVPQATSTCELGYLRYLDLKSHSRFAHEDEVILPPGSAFELLQVSKDQNEVTTIHLKLIIDIPSLAHSGLIMPAARQREMMTDKEIKIVDEEGEILYEALDSIADNKLFEEVEFCHCTFDNRSLNRMIDVISTMEKVKGLKFISCLYQDKDQALGKISSEMLEKIKTSKILKIEITEMSDFYTILGLNQEDCKYWKSLKELNFGFRNFSKITDEGLNHFCLEGLKPLAQLISLRLDLLRCSHVTNQGIINLCSQGLRHLLQLKSLKILFTRCYKITDEGVNILFTDGIQYLMKLQSLQLDFSGCNQITGIKVHKLCSEYLEIFTELTSLSLNFGECFQITNEGFINLCCEGLQNLKKLESLELSFFLGCEITHEGMSRLGDLGLKDLSNLKSLTLHLPQCTKINDEAVKALCDEGLKYLTKVTCLSLNWTACFEITDQGIKYLCLQGLNFLAQRVTSLAINFNSCDKLTDEGIRTLCFQSLINFQRLTSLDLNFSCCELVTNQGLSYFCEKGLENLNKLIFLKLDFFRCIKITDQGLSVLWAWLTRLVKLNSLDVNFSECDLITDEGLKGLFSQCISNLASLRSLNLDFSECSKITDQGLSNLCPQKLSLLTQLEAFQLNLYKCLRITNKGLSDLCSKSQQHMSHLASLNLILSFCTNDCCQGLEHLYQITSLNLGSQPRVLSLQRGILKHHRASHIIETSFRLISRRIRDPSDHLSCDNLILENFKMETDEGKKEAIKCFSQTLLSNVIEEDSTFCKSIAETSQLKLDYSRCNKITDGFLKKLCSFQLKNFIQLTKLDLDISWCVGITNQGVSSLCTEGLQHLSHLTSLNLDFCHCHQITDEGVELLSSQALKYLPELKSLHLNFSWCSKITNTGVTILCTKGLQSLKNLKLLDLCFTLCSEITDEGLNSLCCQGLAHLSHLISLNLRFSTCDKITDVGVNKLCCLGLQHLSGLKFLNLNFSSCSQITDDGVNTLCSQGLKLLPKLIFFGLNLYACNQISEDTIANIHRVLSYFGFSTLL